MAYLEVHEPLILFHVDRAIDEGRSRQDAVEGRWRIDPNRAKKYDLVLAKRANVIIGAYRPHPDSWRPCGDGRWCFDSEIALDVWDQYVGKTVPIKLRGQNPVRYCCP